VVIETKNYLGVHFNLDYVNASGDISESCSRMSDNLRLGKGGNGGRKTTVNFTFVTEKPTRSEIEREVKAVLAELM